MSTESPTTPGAHSTGDPPNGRHRKVLSGIQAHQQHHKRGEDQVTKLVQLIVHQGILGSSKPLTLKEAPTLWTEGTNR